MADEIRIRGKIAGKISASKLQVGKFAELNGSIIYRFDSVIINYAGSFCPGFWMIEKHNHLTPYDELFLLDKEHPGDWQYFVKQIDKPEKKHIDNAIAILKDNSEKGLISGLLFLEHLIRLKELLRAYSKQ